MSDKLRIGILFGGPSAERENSFLWVKQALPFFDRRIFDITLIFVDSKGNFILVENSILTDESTHRFYPSRNLNRGFRVYLENLGNLNETQLYKLVYKIGKQVRAEQLSEYIDLAFLALYGSEAEAGQLQGLLEWHQVPYTGSGLVDSVRANNRKILVELLRPFQPAAYHQSCLPYTKWQSEDSNTIFLETIHTIGFPFFISNPHRSYFSHHASIKKRSLEEFNRAMQLCFGEVTFSKKEWVKLTSRQKKHAIERIHQVEKGFIFPLTSPEGQSIDHPADVLDHLNTVFETTDRSSITLRSAKQPSDVIFESYAHGREFFCTLFQDVTGTMHLLEPLERILQSDGEEHYIPMELPLSLAEELRNQVIQASQLFDQTFLLQIRGVISNTQQIRIFSVDTTPYLTEWSLTLRQVATLGFSPSQFLTYLIQRSLQQRLDAPMPAAILLHKLERLRELLSKVQTQDQPSMGILFEEDAQHYLLAQQKMIEMTQKPFPGVHLEALCLASNGQIIRIPQPWMYFSSFELFKEVLRHKPSPEWQQVAEEFRIQIPAISSKPSAWQLEKWDEQQVAEHVDSLYYVGEGEEVMIQ